MAKRHGAEFWWAHLGTWHRSNLTQVAYCERHGISIKTFSRWRSKERKGGPRASSALTLVPISVGAAATGSVVRLHSPGGWQIELPGSHVSWLADLLRRLP